MIELRAADILQSKNKDEIRKKMQRFIISLTEVPSRFP
jgi:hypothetical protein